MGKVAGLQLSIPAEITAGYQQLAHVATIVPNLLEWAAHNNIT